MAVRVVWRGNRLDLRPTWIVEEVRIHTVKGYMLPDGTKKDTLVAYFKATVDQLTVLFKDYGKANIGHGIFGINAIPLIPGAVLWRFNLPEFKVKEEYNAFEVHAILEGDTAPAPRPE